MQCAVTGWRFARLHAFSAPIAKRFINCVLVVVVVGIVFVYFADHVPLQRILRAYLSRWKPHVIGLACYIKIGRAELAIAALVKHVHSLHGRVAQDTGCAAQVAGNTLGGIDLKHRIACRAARQYARRARNADDPDNAQRMIHKLASAGFFTHIYANPPD